MPTWTQPQAGKSIPMQKQKSTGRASPLCRASNDHGSLQLSSFIYSHVSITHYVCVCIIPPNNASSFLQFYSFFIKPPITTAT